MAGIRMGRVVAAGLVAGLIINIGESILNVPLAGEELAETQQARNLPPVGGGAIAYFVVMCFLLGILMVWRYRRILVFRGRQGNCWDLLGRTRR